MVSRTRPEHDNEVNAVNLRYGPGSATIHELEHLTDKDLSTFTYIGSGDLPWFEVVLDRTYHISVVILYTLFLTDW